MPRTNPRIATLLRGALAALLLVAAGLKGYELLSGPPAGAGLLHQRWFLIAVVELEGVLGLWLLSGLKPIGAAKITAAAFLLFAAVSCWQALSGEASCGCFGRVHVHPWWTFGLDLLACAAALCAALQQPPRPARWPAVRLAAIGLVLVAVGVPLGIKMLLFEPPTARIAGAAASEPAIPDPQEWVGHPFPLSPYIDIGPQLTQGKWAVLLYRSDCQHCEAAVAEYEQLARQWASQKVPQHIALVDMSSDYPPATLPASTPGGPLYGQCRDTLEWYGITPTLVVLVDGRVIDVGEGGGDCQWGERTFPQ